ncbi:MAG: ABC transporter ATP-binding protein [Planctomycetes bacterium]|nr:ABC transporter ATP-binding protein [Planctomycetota bacterium]
MAEALGRRAREVTGADPIEGLRLDRVSRRFGTTAALRDVSFHVPPCALAVIVGPSGCGKSTALRTVAGFESPDAGRVLLDGLDVTRVPPERRSAAMVFQHYALFPNLDVAGNVAYGPRVQGVEAAPRATLVREMLELVGLAGLDLRRPHELSGGQQQRVALARALAARPKLLLLDEPLSNVDPSLRRDTRTRLRTLHEARGVTTLWVTHDREEALAVADIVIVMRAGEVVQSGSPREVCESPATTFVAEFLLDANVLPPSAAKAFLSLATDEVVAARPDHVGLERIADDSAPLRVVTVAYGPVRTEVVCEGVLAASGETFRVRSHVDTDALPPGLRAGAPVRAFVRPADLLRFRR